MNGRKVTWAQTHTPCFVPNVCNFKVTLTADPTGQLADLKMTKVEGGLMMTCKGAEVFVPDANISHLVFAKENTAK